MARRQNGRTYSDQMRGIVEKYTESGQPWPTTTRQIAAWAIRNKLWHPQPSTIVSRCADDLRRAMRDEYFTDPQGRRVRTKHAARVKDGKAQRTLWADIRDASRNHMEIAFKQRRKQIVGDCWQLKCDVDSYNQNSSTEQPIQMILDFTEDMEELELDSEWAAA